LRPDAASALDSGRERGYNREQSGSIKLPGEIEASAERGEMMSRLATMVLVPGAVLLCGAAGCEKSNATAERCREVIETMAACYPDLAAEAQCDEETIAMFEDYDMASQDCAGIDDAGKADLFAFGGCGPGEHVCGWIFCCDDYVLTWFPSGESDWDIVPVVQRFQSAMPPDVRAEMEGATRTELLAGMSRSFEQAVAEYLDRPAVDMAVEVSMGLAEVPFDEFVRRLPAQDWGINLDHYLGGEVMVYETDLEARAVRQLERMVLSPMPCDWESPLSNNDMTKVEVIEYTENKAVVYWRVMYSNNNSTETDVGSVAFSRYDETSTLITFHSAHRLNAPGGIHIPNAIMQPALESTFLDFIARYKEIVESP